MKKIAAVLLIALIAVSLFAGGASEKKSESVIKIGATPDPHVPLLQLVVEDLAKEGYKLEVIEFTDYVTPNEALESGDVDANFFQHIP